MSDSSDRFLLAGVMGWPVMHSRSPMLHGYWLREYGLKGAYLPLAVQPEGLPAALRSLKPLGFAGCNLTIPHKQHAMSLVDEVDEVGRQIGAISCVVVRPDGSLAGSNNDCYGFIEHLRQSAPDWRAEAGPAVVLGAGGGSRAICYALAQAGVPEVRLINRTFDRASALAAEFGSPLRALPWEQRADAMEGAMLVVNTTSLGMVGQAPLDLSIERLPPQAIAYDIVYTPLMTPFLAAAHSRGNRTIDGLGMLLHQAVPAWRAWFGIETRVTPALRALLVASL